MKNLMVKSSYVGSSVGGFATRLSCYARQKMYGTLMSLAHLDRESSILDVGVTCDRRDDSNFFEKLYPHSDRIVAVGMEDAQFLEQDFPV